MLAPTQDLLDNYKKRKGSWEEYECGFLHLMEQRGIESKIAPGFFDVPTVLLCSERTAEHCHRRLILQYLETKWGDLTVVHL
jgi:uncharacterized protein (DUF488 family)